MQTITKLVDNTTRIDTGEVFNGFPVIKYLLTDTITIVVVGDEIRYLSNSIEAPIWVLLYSEAYNTFGTADSYELAEYLIENDYIK